MFENLSMHDGLAQYCVELLLLIFIQKVHIFENKTKTLFSQLEKLLGIVKGSIL